MRYWRIGMGLVAVALTTTACWPMGWPMGVGRGGFLGRQYASNGERIYFTGTSTRDRVSYGLDFGGGVMGGMGMMGVQLACADCHGPTGRGGAHIMHMVAMDAPDIRWSTLTEAEHGEQGDEGDMEHPPYDETTFKRAVTQGLDPAGHPLRASMPRWQMSEQDLDDLIGYLKTLD
jgi:cytochrome c oxidase subunit 2